MVAYHQISPNMHLPGSIAITHGIASVYGRICPCIQYHVCNDNESKQDPHRNFITGDVHHSAMIVNVQSDCKLNALNIFIFPCHCDFIIPTFSSSTTIVKRPHHIFTCLPTSHIASMMSSSHYQPTSLLICSKMALTPFCDHGCIFHQFRRTFDTFGFMKMERKESQL
jgi:hypothetical protein